MEGFHIFLRGTHFCSLRLASPIEEMLDPWEATQTSDSGRRLTSRAPLPTPQGRKSQSVLRHHHRRQPRGAHRHGAAPRRGPEDGREFPRPVHGRAGLWLRRLELPPGHTQFHVVSLFLPLPFVSRCVCWLTFDAVMQPRRRFHQPQR